MPNVNGLTLHDIRHPHSYPFAAMTPILSGSTKGVIHTAELRSVLARLNTTLGDSPFAHVPGTHFARWCIVDDLPQLGYPTKEDHLKSKYLLLETDFDGERDAWIDAVATAMPDAITAVYRHCVGFPGVQDLPTFRRYLTRCQIDTTLGFTPYPTASRDTVLNAIASQRTFVSFAREMQGVSDIKLRAGFTDMMKRIRSTPTPPAGRG